MSFRLLIFSLFCVLQNPLAQVEPAFPHLVYLQNVRDFHASSDGNEVWFTIQSPDESAAVIAYMQRRDGEWMDPQLAPFSGQFRDIEPFLSSDGLRLYFSSNRPATDKETAAKDYDIWYVERATTEANWSNPIRMGDAINSLHNEFYPAVCANGNLYFTADGPNSLGKDDLYMARFNGKKYEKAVPLGPPINSSGYEFNAFVSADESYLIFTRYNAPDGLGSGDLYISYRATDGNWQPAENLGVAINSNAMDYCPFVDEKEHFLYFTSRRNIPQDQEFKDLNSFERYCNRYTNGFSRLYKVAFTPKY